MSEPEKRENSVLFSLRELQQIEEERVTEEESAATEAEEQRIRAQMEAERSARETEEARVKAERDAEQARLDAHNQQIRGEEMRLQEAETRARIEAQTQIEQQRLEQEMELRRHEVSKKRPTGLIAVAVVLVFVVGGLGWWAYGKVQEGKEKDRIAAAEKAQYEADLREYDRKVTAIQGQRNEAVAALEQATTDAERDAAKAQLAAARRKLKALEAGRKKPGKAGKRSKKRKKPKGTIKLSEECMNDPNSPNCP